jgi:tetratricopeptide (TPR) repeat protein
MIWALCFSTAFLGANEPPDWFTPLRDTVYNGSGDAASVARLGSEVEERAKLELEGAELYNTLSFCEFLIAKAYQSENSKEDAIRHFERGFDYAGDSVKIEPSSGAYRMMAENISQLCTLKSTAWVIANGLRVERYARKGLEYDKRNAACAYLIASRWVYAPQPFNNINKGINELKEILTGSYDIQKDDYFNMYYAIAYAYNRNKQPAEMKPWLEKALAVYPANRDARNLSLGKVRIADSVNSGTE